MNYNTVFVVLKEGEIVYASSDKDSAEAYSYNQDCRGIDEVLADWGNDDPTDEDIAEAAFQAGLDGDICDIQSVNLSGKTEDDTIILEDGSEVTVAEIVAVMDEFE